MERELPHNLWTEQTTIVLALGTDMDRKNYTEYMNKKLLEYCEKYNYVFFNIYNKYVNKRGFLNEELSDTNCHIKNPIYMKEFLIDYLSKIR